MIHIDHPEKCNDLYFILQLNLIVLLHSLGSGIKKSLIYLVVKKSLICLVVKKSLICLILVTILFLGVKTLHDPESEEYSGNPKN